MCRALRVYYMYDIPLTFTAMKYIFSLCMYCNHNIVPYTPSTPHWVRAHRGVSTEQLRKRSYLLNLFSLLSNIFNTFYISKQRLCLDRPEVGIYVSKTQNFHAHAAHRHSRVTKLKNFSFCMQHTTGTRESLHEKMAGNPKTSEARREESRNRPNP